MLYPILTQDQLSVNDLLILCLMLTLLLLLISFLVLINNDDFPTENAFDNTFATRPAGERLKFLQDVVKKFLCKYVSNPKTHAIHIYSKHESYSRMGSTTKHYGPYS